MEKVFRLKSKKNRIGKKPVENLVAHLHTRLGETWCFVLESSCILFCLFYVLRRLSPLRTFASSHIFWERVATFLEKISIYKIYNQNMKITRRPRTNFTALAPKRKMSWVKRFIDGHQSGSKTTKLMIKRIGNSKIVRRLFQKSMDSK